MCAQRVFPWEKREALVGYETEVKGHGCDYCECLSTGIVPVFVNFGKVWPFWYECINSDNLLIRTLTPKVLLIRFKYISFANISCQWLTHYCITTALDTQKHTDASIFTEEIKVLYVQQIWPNQEDFNFSECQGGLCRRVRAECLSAIYIYLYIGVSFLGEQLFCSACPFYHIRRCQKPSWP